LTASAGGEETIGITRIPIRVNGDFEEEILFVHVTVDCGKLHVVWPDNKIHLFLHEELDLLDRLDISVPWEEFLFLL
jgi:hypothetical protein